MPENGNSATTMRGHFRNNFRIQVLYTSAQARRRNTDLLDPKSWWNFDLKHWMRCTNSKNYLHHHQLHENAGKTSAGFESIPVRFCPERRLWDSHKSPFSGNQSHVPAKAQRGCFENAAQARAVSSIATTSFSQNDIEYSERCAKIIKCTFHQANCHCQSTWAIKIP